MANISKQAAITLLEKLIGQAKAIPGTLTSEYRGWERSAKLAIKHIFGEQSGHITEFENGLSIETQRAIMESMLEEIQQYWPDDESIQPSIKDEQIKPRGQAFKKGITIQDKRNVFVVHGRNLAARDAMFSFLRSIGLWPLEWSEIVELTGKTSPYIGDILDAAFSNAQAVLVLMTPDDKARVRKRFVLPDDSPSEIELTNQARPNVLFEAGMAMGRDADRTVLVQLGKLRPFSDISGIHVIKLDATPQKRQHLAKRLKSAGCPVNLSGTDWQTAGDFSL